MKSGRYACSNADFSFNFFLTFDFADGNQNTGTGVFGVLEIISEIILDIGELIGEEIGELTGDEIGELFGDDIGDEREELIIEDIKLDILELFEELIFELIGELIGELIFELGIEDPNAP